MRHLEPYSATIVMDACASIDIQLVGNRVCAKDVHTANLAALAFALGSFASAAKAVVAVATGDGILQI